MKNKFFLAMCLAILMVAVPAAAAFDSGPFEGRGILRAIRSMDRLVVLENEDGFEFLNLTEDASIQDLNGASISLRDLPLGSQVEYSGQYWQGLNFASTLRVSPASLVISAR
ncbi:MAG: hypothetical protein ACREQP_06875 [Candidatus Binatia bacterium]